MLDSIHLDALAHQEILCDARPPRRAKGDLHNAINHRSTVDADR